jgi:HNH endonuclease
VLWARDAPRSIGTPEAGVVRFQLSDINNFLEDLDPHEMLSMHSKIADLVPSGFQIWGIPEGARDVLTDMKTGDFLMLLESSDFRYVGQVIHRVSQPCWDLSRHIWSEQRFPIIILLQGEMILYEWHAFVTDFAFASNYHMRGNTMRLKEDRVASSRFGSEEKFIAHILTTTGTNVADMKRDFQAFANNLEVHFSLVKDREAQQKFRRDVLAAQGHRCVLCDIPFPAVLDASHIIPKEAGGSDDPRNGLAMCVLHHRMFDAGMFTVLPSTGRIIPSRNLQLSDLRILHEDINHVSRKPHDEALEWRWKGWRDNLKS